MSATIDAAEAHDRPRKRRRQMLTAEAFTARARAVHGDRYDYSNVVYRGTLSPVVIECSKHGKFEQKPNNHLYGKAGCAACGEERRLRAISTLSTEAFIARSRALNGEKFDYEKTIYTGLLDKVTLTCRTHGDFEQTPNNHLYSRAGCPSCGNEAIWSSNRTSLSEFVKAARSVHGSSYDYSHVVYVNAMTTVQIICAAHGPFNQRPLNHLGGSGCRACAFDRRRLDKASFVRRAKDIFDRQYDYSLIPDGWVPTRERVAIVCPSHGQFEAVAGEHLRGRGCLGCVESQCERRIRDLLTEANIPFVAQWKHRTLRHKGPLRYDFMLPNTRTLLEYDGVFHFRIVQWSGESREEAVARFDEGQIRDAIKTQWARDNGWHLIRLSDPKSIRRDLIASGIIPSHFQTRRAA